MTTSASYLSFLATHALAAACGSSTTTGGDAGNCTPTTCAAEQKNCGDIVDGCGKSLNCGTCTGGDTCGGSSPNVCGVGTCTPTTCADEGKNCGLISDACNTVLDCGTCGSGMTCASNVCVASTTTDAS